MSELSFRDCYAVLSGGGNVISLTGTTASTYNLIIDNMRVEGLNGVDHVDARLIYAGQDNYLDTSRITGVLWTIESDFVIEIAASSQLTNAYLDLRHDLPGTTKWMVCYGNLIRNYIIVRDAATISIDTGNLASGNVVVCFGSGSPFTGAGASDYFLVQSNIVLQLDTSAPSLLSVAKQSINGSAIGDHSATPSVADSSLFSLAQDQATNVTNFSNMVDGQEITLIGTNTNTTLKHGATIKLAGAADYVSAIGGVITLVYFGNNTAWYEKSRMVPA